MNVCVHSSAASPSQGAARREPVRERAAWSRSDLADDESWIHRINAADHEELEEALAGVPPDKRDALSFTQADFPLPTLGPRLERMVHELEYGRGCVLIRGLDLDRYAHKTARQLYWGMGTWLGEVIAQNSRGELIGEVSDGGRDYAGNNVRGYTTKAQLRPHCDAADVVGLLCLHPARSGGASVFASSVTIFNELLRTSPEYLRPLERGFHFDLRGEGATGDPDEVTAHRVPVFSWHAGRLSCRYNQRTIEDGQRKVGEALGSFEQSALTRIGELAADPRFRYDMRFERGDIQLLNNHSVLHGRTEFEDWPDAARKRRLLRLWLNLRDGRPLAPAFAERLNTGPRGGVAVKGVDY